ncbi:MAG: hypothetical protein MI865_00450, partial [Proteobacteria bacterium]|nr:hypothetical protein [Pseudomonadota bacterium]
EKTSKDQDRTAKTVGKLKEKIETTEGLGEAKRHEQRKSENSQGESKPSAEQPSEGSQQKAKDAQQQGEKAPPESPSEGQPQQDGQGAPKQSPGDGQPGPNRLQDDQPPEEQQQSPMERAAQRLKQAQQRMQQARRRLEEAKREQALEKQEEALRELEQAKAELERILRQLREEELERMLVLLEARIRKMLDDQTVVYEETKKLSATQEQSAAHELEIAGGRLRRREESIAQEADRALILLREDGTSVAFPEAIEQARDDMVTVAQRLGDVKLGMITQGLEEDIIEALEETLAALQQALKQLREQQAQQQQGGGQPGEQPLVDQLAELRMIRALQNRINRRTVRYGKLLGDEYALKQDLRAALTALARRQERVFEATRDLESGRNQ